MCNHPTCKIAPSYLDHLPLERQVRIMRREGLTIDSQTLWDQIATVADVLRPTYTALGRYVLQAPVVGADETWWRLMGRLMERPVDPTLLRRGQGEGP